MKVAVQFFGHLRTFEKTYQSVQKNLLSHYDCDVFFHTWDTMEMKFRSYPRKPGAWFSDKTTFSPLAKENIALKIKKYYNPTTLLIEKSREIKPSQETIIQSPINPQAKLHFPGLISMYYSRYRVNKLRMDYEDKNNITYDWIVLIRPDVKLGREFNIARPVQQYELSGRNPNNCRFCLYTPWNSWNRKRLSFLSDTDILWFARPKVINKSVQIYEALKDADPREIEKTYFCGEQIQCKYDYENKIELTQVPCYKEIVRFKTKPQRFLKFMEKFLKPLSLYELLICILRGYRYIKNIIANSPQLGKIHQKDPAPNR